MQFRKQTTSAQLLDQRYLVSGSSSTVAENHTRGALSVRLLHGEVLAAYVSSGIAQLYTALLHCMVGV